jgi:hypothetical protein
MWKDAKHGITFPLTNLPYGAILFTNGKPAFTNLPHLLLAIDVSDFDRTNIIPDLGNVKLLNLTEDFIFIKNDHEAIADTKALLTIPICQALSNPIVKFVLRNDTGVMVSNIVFAFNASRGFSWLSNDVWCSSVIPPDSPSNNIIRECFFENWDAIKPGDIVMLAPIRFEATNANNADLIGLSLYAHNMPQQLIGFLLRFCPTNAESHSVLVPSAGFSKISNLQVTTNFFRFSFPGPMRMEFR